MKKLIFIVTALMMYLSGMLAVFAVGSSVYDLNNTLIQLNIVDENGFSNPYAITREDCLISIMRVIGLTDDQIEKLDGADFISFADTAPFSYFGCADAGKIAYGEECVVDYPTLRTAYTLKNTDIFFFPNRAVSVKECLAFMNRCLQPGKPDFNLTIENAKDNGLINAQDDFCQNPNSFINQDCFFVLLERLLQQNRYKYYGQNGDFKMQGSIDEDRSISYFEMLNQRMQQDRGNGSRPLKKQDMGTVRDH